MPHPTGPHSSVGRCIQEFFAVQAIKKLSAATEKAYRCDLNEILKRALRGAQIDEIPISTLDRHAMREAFGDFSRDHAKKSVSRAHYTWRQFFDFLVADEIIEGSPMAAVPQPKLEKQRAKPFEGWDDDFADRLLASAAKGDRKTRGTPWPDRDLAVIATLLLTGVRAEEFCALRINSLEGYPDSRVFRIKGKGNKWRFIPVQSELDELLGSYLESRKAQFPNVKIKRDSPLFLGTRSDGITAITQGQLRHLLASCLSAAGLANRKPDGAMTHAFRHTFATTLAADDANVLQIASIMGHDSIATTQNYMQSLAKHERAAAAKHPTYATLRSLNQNVIDLQELEPAQ